MFWQILLFFLAFTFSCNGNVEPTEDYSHSAVMNPDGTFKIYWRNNETHIVFEIHGNTIGWVGMGISPNGGMFGADIVVGWVKNGIAVISDYHGIGTTVPELDPEQNVELLMGFETDGWTVIKYQRELASCEPVYDLPITSDTLKIIYAFGAKDPDGDGLSNGDYHGSNRGVKSLLLLEPSRNDESVFPEGETHQSFELLNDNFQVPAETTYYNCRLHKIPNFSTKQHLVKIEPVIQPGHERLVHHVLVYQCTGEINDESVGKNSKCYSSNMPPDFSTCQFVIQAWAIGGGPIYYPSHAGFPLGEEDSPKYVVVETHYDNPIGSANFVDSSGLRFIYTSQLRQYDAGILETGVTVSGWQHIIPPNAESYLSYGDCSPQCLEGGRLAGSVNKLNVFGTLLHSHVIGTAVTLRHIRDGIELPYIAKDSSYDFNYQETRMLSEEREILSGDSLQVVCNYKTKGVRTEMTVGGLETEKEMCLVFVYYYPKMPLAYCEAAPNLFNTLNYFGIKNIQFINTEPWGAYNDINDILITSPENIANQTVAEYLNAMTWDQEAIEKMSDEMKNIRRTQNCRGTKSIPGLDGNIPAIVVDQPYVEEELNCSYTSQPTTTIGVPVTQTSVPSELSPTENYPHMSVMDPEQKYKLYWNFTQTHITFEIHTKTSGWIGMGISPNGGMTGADIVVGWVKNGIAVISDRNGIGNTVPELDPEQNVELLAGFETDGWTVIKYRRELASCEPVYDLPITSNTLKIIYAFGEEDPDGEDLTGENYHQTNRGAKSLLLLEPTKTDEAVFPEGETHQSFDLLNDNFQIPAETTYYNCRLHKIPDFISKQHLVKNAILHIAAQRATSTNIQLTLKESRLYINSIDVEPIIQPGNELYVHHILVYQCIGNVNDSSIGSNTKCYSSNMPPDFTSCQFVIQAWGIGGGAIYYPSHAGFPLGDNDSPKYVVVETHYDNPMALSGIVDSSGLRFVYTGQLRQHDAGIVETGFTVAGLQHIIPPNAESYLNYGECSSQCLAQSLKRSRIDKINIFGVLLHSHLLGVGLTLRHLRDGVELPYIAKDSSYDFNYQETRMLSEEREILSGDSLQIVCNYKTKGVRTEMSVGGLDTRKEMCIVYVYYYPKMPLHFCETAPEYTTYINYFGIEEMKPLNEQFGIYDDIHDMMIVAPENLANQTFGDYLNSMDWNDEANDKLSEDMKKILRVQNCRGSKVIPGVNYTCAAPTVEQPYVEENPTCLNPQTQVTTEANGEETTTGGASQLSLSLSIYTLVLAFTVAFL